MRKREWKESGRQSDNKRIRRIMEGEVMIRDGRGIGMCAS